MRKTKVLSNYCYDLSIDISERKKKYICKKKEKYKERKKKEKKRRRRIKLL